MQPHSTWTHPRFLPNNLSKVPYLPFPDGVTVERQAIRCSFPVNSQAPKLDFILTTTDHRLHRSKFVTMAGLRQCLHDVTPYLILLVTVSTLGSLQFGIHLVRHLANHSCLPRAGILSNKHHRQSSMPPKMSSHATRNPSRHSIMSERWLHLPNPRRSHLLFFLTVFP